MVVTTGGSLRQELKVEENSKDPSTSFLGFQLLPEVPVPAAPSGGTAERARPPATL